MIIAGYSFVFLTRVKDVTIEPSDMNVLLITLMTLPRTEIASKKVCLPKIAEDGYLSLTADYVSPDISIVFICIDSNNSQETLQKIKRIAQEMKDRNLVTEVSNSIKKNYIQRMIIIPNGKLKVVNIRNRK